MAAAIDDAPEGKRPPPAGPWVAHLLYLGGVLLAGLALVALSPYLVEALQWRMRLGTAFGLSLGLAVGLIVLLRLLLR
jgi:hypothetical protein